MTVFSPISFRSKHTLTALAALVAASPAMADVTADDVWQNLRAPILALGGQIDAETTRKDNRLEIGEQTMTFQLPMGLGEFVATSSGYGLAENGDGTVSAIYPESLVMSFRATGEEGELFSAGFEMDTSGYTMTAAGTPGDVSYDYALGSADMRLTDFKMPEEAGMEMKLQGTMSGATGMFRITEGDITRMSISGTAGEAIFNSETLDQLGILTKTSQTTSGGVTEMTMAIPTGKLALMNLSQGLRDGLDVALMIKGSRIEAVTETFLNDEPLLDQSYAYLMDDAVYRLDTAGFAATGSISDLVYAMSFEGMPFSGSAERMDSSLAFPVNATDGPVDAQLGMTLEGLKLDEGVWALFDPAQALPRDPARLKLDLSGQIENVVDLLNIEGLMMSGDELPVLVQELTLNALELQAAGASVSGKGAVTLDNSDYETFGGIPALDGAIDLEVIGANGLMDKLVAAGIVPEEQMMGPRMMMGLFAVPGDGEDTLLSTIEVKPDGQVLANGQRLK